MVNEKSLVDDLTESKQKRYGVKEQSAAQRSLMEVMPSEGMSDVVSDDGFRRLVKEYPQVQKFSSVEQMPRGFVERLLEGQHPLDAWESYLNELKRLEEVFMQQMFDGKRKAAPSVRNSGASGDDGFVRSLFGM